MLCKQKGNLRETSSGWWRRNSNRKPNGKYKCFSLGCADYIKGIFDILRLVIIFEGPFFKSIRVLRGI